MPYNALHIFFLRITVHPFKLPITKCARTAINFIIIDNFDNFIIAFINTKVKGFRKTNLRRVAIFLKMLYDEKSKLLRGKACHG
jgi:hypothetical protein